MYIYIYMHMCCQAALRAAFLWQLPSVDPTPVGVRLCDRRSHNPMCVGMPVCRHFYMSKIVCPLF